MRRYSRDKRIAGGKLSTAKAVRKIRRARELGYIDTKDVVLSEASRLDHLAATHVGSSSLWWVLAALSDIGWGMQVPAGTIIKIPKNMNKIATMVG